MGLSVKQERVQVPIPALIRRMKKPGEPGRIGVGFVALHQDARHRDNQSGQAVETMVVMGFALFRLQSSESHPSDQRCSRE